MNQSPSLSDIHAFAIDADGVLWHGEKALPGFIDFFAFLRQNNIPFAIVTNNATKTQQDIVNKFARLGVEIAPHEIVTSSIATAEYLKTQYPVGTRLHAIGNGARHALEEAGFVLADDNVEAVVVGMDFTIDYPRLRTAALLINAGARFIGTNSDRSFPFEGGFAPGNGAILAALSAATDVSPFIIGKPESPMFEIALRHLKSDAVHTVMLGDRLETDILGGQRAGLKTILVLSGVTSAEMLAQSDTQPDWVFEGIDTLVDTLKTK